MLGEKIKYAISGISIILLWFLAIKDFISPYLSNINPVFAFLIYNILFFVGIGFIANTFNTKKITIIIIAILFYVGTDILIAPYLISTTGEIIKTPDLWYVSADVAVAVLWQLIGITGRLLWFFVYIITPILLLVIIPISIGNFSQIKQLLRIGT